MQSMSTTQVPHGWYVEEWFAIWTPLQLVQNTLPASGATTTGGRRSGCSSRQSENATANIRIDQHVESGMITVF